MSVPEQVEYRRCAVQRQTLAGAVPLASMARLADAVLRLPDKQAQVSLAFVEDDQRRVRVSGRITAPVELLCQRCSTAFVHAVDTTVAGVVVADDASAATVPHADEPILAAGDVLDVHALVEDELLLALPMVMHCGHPDCQTRYNVQAPPAQTAPAPSGRRTDNPFAVLDQLRHDDDTNDSD